MRYLIAAAVVLMLFVLPAGSWWYLKSGLEYRIQVRDETAVKSSFDEQLTDLSETSRTALRGALENKITVLNFSSPLTVEQSDVFMRIVEKYGGRELFQLLHFSEIDSISKVDVTNHKADFPIYLIDQKLQIRNTYTWEEDQIKQLVIHIAAVLPVPGRETISLKRDLKTNEPSN